MYLVPHFGHAKVNETRIWTACFQILAKTMHWSSKSLGTNGFTIYALLKEVVGDIFFNIQKYSKDIQKNPSIKYYVIF